MDGTKLKIGDLVIHNKKNWIGTVYEFMSRHPIALVDLSNAKGIKFRWIRIKDLNLLIKN